MGKYTHEMVRDGDSGQFLKDTERNRKDKDNTIERVPNPGRGDTKNDKRSR